MESWPCRSIRRRSHCRRTVPENEPDISATLHVVVRRSAVRRKSAALRRLPKATSAQRCLATHSSMPGIAFRKMLKCSSLVMARMPHIAPSNSDHWKRDELAGCAHVARCAISPCNHLKNHNRPWPHLVVFILPSVSREHGTTPTNATERQGSDLGSGILIGS